MMVCLAVYVYLVRQYAFQEAPAGYLHMPFHIRSKRRCLFLHMLKPHGRSSCFGGFSQGVEPSQELPGLRKCCDLGFLAGADVFFGLGAHFRGVRGGPFSALRRRILDPGRSRKREPKWIPKLGPPKRKTCYSRANWGSILGPPSLASANPVTQHAGGDRRPAFL